MDLYSCFNLRMDIDNFVPGHISLYSVQNRTELRFPEKFTHSVFSVFYRLFRCLVLDCR
jgi:hypothetical protein